jgi:hypothetical protein
MMNPTVPQESKGKTRPRPVKARSEPPPEVSKPSLPPVSSCDDLKVLIAKRAYQLYAERGYRHGYALDDWLEAEREILSQVPPV